MQSLPALQRKGCHKIRVLAGLGKLEESCKAVDNHKFRIFYNFFSHLPTTYFSLVFPTSFFHEKVS